MSRIRTIKPDLFKHEALFEAEQGCGLPLRLTFIALLTCCDREGRFRWQVRRLKLDLLPYDDIDLADILKALQGYGFIQQYSHQGSCTVASLRGPNISIVINVNLKVTCPL